jgi:replication fork clamp-binding protein CrfC
MFVLALVAGAVRIASEGQDPGIVEEIRRMIENYINKDNVIILAVNAANTDLANSDAIAFSRQVCSVSSLVLFKNILETTVQILISLSVMGE